jgi:hypothetical protein
LETDDVARQAQDKHDKDSNRSAAFKLAPRRKASSVPTRVSRSRSSSTYALPVLAQAVAFGSTFVPE